jgi:hypothetical protein
VFLTIKKRPDNQNPFIICSPHNSETKDLWKFNMLYMQFLNNPVKYRKVSYLLSFKGSLCGVGFEGEIFRLSKLLPQDLSLKHTYEHNLTVSMPANSMSTAIPVISLISSSSDDKYSSSKDFVSLSVLADCATDSFFLDIKSTAILKDKLRSQVSSHFHIPWGVPHYRSRQDTAVECQCQWSLLLHLYITDENSPLHTEGA